ncbi:hypothetical protein LCGC14_1505380 [marine sediment metagenome]|uniref:Mutator family transposase n=1 Tax=marine sediment metagenome TaxID=412755 RepID=A0A0F9JNM1_9ZZZZ
MTDTTMPLIELLRKHDEEDFLRAVSEAVLQLLMEHDVEGQIGAGRHERSDGRLTYRNVPASKPSSNSPTRSVRGNDILVIARPHEPVRCIPEAGSARWRSCPRRAQQPRDRGG